jgi:hypothetical protein
MNLVDTIKQQLSPDMISKLGRVIGEDSQTTSACAAAAVPTVLAGLTSAASTPDGAQKLAEAVDEADEPAQNLAGALGGSGAGSIIEKGSSMLRGLLGGNLLSSLGTALAKHSGMGGAGITAMLGALTPLILGTLQKVKASMGLDAGGLANLLSSQKANIAGAIPSGLSNMLGSVPGLSSLGLADAGRKAGDAARAAGTSAAGAGRSVMAAVGDAGRRGYRRATEGASPARWMVPLGLVLALGVGWLIWKYVLNRQPTDTVADRAARDVRDGASRAIDQAKQAGGDAARTAGAVIGNAQQAAGDAARQASEKTSQAVDSAAASVQSAAQVGEDLKGAVTNLTESFTKIKDPASAEAAIPKFKEISTKVDSLNAMASNLPSDARQSISSALSGSMTKLKELADKAMAIPGVSEKLKPVVEPLMQKLNALAGA